MKESLLSPSITSILSICFLCFVNGLVPAFNTVLINTSSNNKSPLLSSLKLPIKIPFSSDVEEGITGAFNAMVDSTEFYNSVPLTPKQQPIKSIGAVSIPLFGEDVILTLDINSEENCCVLSLSGDNLTNDDFGWVAAKFYESKALFEQNGISTISLRKVVAKHFNAQPPHPGYDAQLTSNRNLFRQLFDGKEFEVLRNLKSSGYAVVDTILPATPVSCTKLSEKLIEKTCQGKHVRTDTVSFITRDDALHCELETQFDLLMAMASWMNENYPFLSSKFEPIAPATRDLPLTNPLSVQAAEYREGDFYVAHSDNSLDGSVRSNFREFTCIYYLNDDWYQEIDGGSLRLYLNSNNLISSTEAKRNCQYIDINPQNGRLLIFDSKLYHSVEAVKTNKSRLALTLWITRPEKNGVQGERWDEGLALNE